jgi:tetratricopeptide (TPR) repeat protein
MGRPAEAIAVFSKLTEDYPELPEPYNNLAVLYARQKQYDKARTALEMAIRTYPGYATAYENLGDVHANLASQAYDKALQLDPAKKIAQTKLFRLRELISTAGVAAGKQVATIGEAGGSGHAWDGYHADCRRYDNACGQNDGQARTAPCDGDAGRAAGAESGGRRSSAAQDPCTCFRR